MISLSIFFKDMGAQKAMSARVLPINKFKYKYKYTHTHTHTHKLKHMI